MSLWVEGEQRERWTATTGNQIIRTWEGPESEEDYFLAHILPTGYTELVRRHGKDDWVNYEASYGAESSDSGTGETGLVSRQWNLDSFEEQLPINECENAQKLAEANPNWLLILAISVNAYKLNTQRIIKAALESGTETDIPEYEIPARPTVTGYSATELAELDDLAEQYVAILRKNDAPTFPVTGYILRKTEIVLSTTSLYVSHANTNRFHKYTTLCRIEPTLPAAILIKPTDLRTWYFLKRSADVGPSTGGQWQLTQEYLCAKGFESFMYGTAL